MNILDLQSLFEQFLKNPFWVLLLVGSLAFSVLKWFVSRKSLSAYSRYGGYLNNTSANPYYDGQYGVRNTKYRPNFSSYKSIPGNKKSESDEDHDKLPR